MYYNYSRTTGGQYKWHAICSSNIQSEFTRQFTDRLTDFIRQKHADYRAHLIVLREMYIGLTKTANIRCISQGILRLFFEGCPKNGLAPTYMSLHQLPLENPWIIKDCNCYHLHVFFQCHFPPQVWGKRFRIYRPVIRFHFFWCKYFKNSCCLVNQHAYQKVKCPGGVYRGLPPSIDLCSRWTRNEIRTLLISCFGGHEINGNTVQTYR